MEISTANVPFVFHSIRLKIQLLLVICFFFLRLAPNFLEEKVDFAFIQFRLSTNVSFSSRSVDSVTTPKVSDSGTR